MYIMITVTKNISNNINNHNNNIKAIYNYKSYNSAMLT